MEGTGSASALRDTGAMVMDGAQQRLENTDPGVCVDAIVEEVAAGEVLSLSHEGGDAPVPGGRTVDDRAICASGDASAAATQMITTSTNAALPDTPSNIKAENTPDADAGVAPERVAADEPVAEVAGAAEVVGEAHAVESNGAPESPAEACPETAEPASAAGDDGAADPQQPQQRVAEAGGEMAAAEAPVHVEDEVPAGAPAAAAVDPPLAPLESDSKPAVVVSDAAEIVAAIDEAAPHAAADAAAARILHAAEAVVAGGVLDAAVSAAAGVAIAAAEVEAEAAHPHASLSIPTDGVADAAAANGADSSMWLVAAMAVVVNAVVLCIMYSIVSRGPAAVTPDEGRSCVDDRALFRFEEIASANEELRVHNDALMEEVRVLREAHADAAAPATASVRRDSVTTETAEDEAATPEAAPTPPPLADRSEEIHALTAEVTSLRERCAALDTARQDAAAAAAAGAGALKEELAALRAQHHADMSAALARCLEAERGVGSPRAATATSRADDDDDGLRALEERCADHEQKMKRSLEQLAELEGQLAAKTQLVDAAAAAADESAAQMRALSEEIQHLQLAATAAAAETTVTQEALGASRADAEGLRAQMTTLQTECETMRAVHADVDGLRVQITALETELETARTAQVDAEGLRARVTALEVDLEAARTTEADRTAGEVERHAKEAARLFEEMDALRAALSDNADEASRAREAHAAAAEALHTLEDAHADLKSQLASAVQEINAFKSDAEATADDHAHELAGATAQVELLQTTLRAAEAAREVHERKEADMAAALARAQADAVSLRETADAAAQESSAKLASVVDELAAAKDYAQQLLAEVASLEKAVDGARAECAARAGDLEASRDEAAALRAETARLSETVVLEQQKGAEATKASECAHALLQAACDDARRERDEGARAMKALQEMLAAREADVTTLTATCEARGGEIAANKETIAGLEEKMIHVTRDAEGLNEVLVKEMGRAQAEILQSRDAHAAAAATLREDLQQARNDVAAAAAARAAVETQLADAQEKMSMSCDALNARVASLVAEKEALVGEHQRAVEDLRAAVPSTEALEAELKEVKEELQAARAREAAAVPHRADAADVDVDAVDVCAPVEDVVPCSATASPQSATAADGGGRAAVEDPAAAAEAVAEPPPAPGVSFTEADMAAVRGELLAARAEVEHLEELDEEARTALAAIQAENEDLKEAARRVEAQVDVYETATITALRADLTAATATAEDAQRGEHTARAAVEALQREIEGVVLASADRIRIEGLQHQLAVAAAERIGALERDAAELRSAAADAADKLAAATATEGYLREELAAYEADCVSYGKRVRELEAAIADATGADELCTLQDRLAHTCREKDELATAFEALTHDRAAVGKSLAEATDTLRTAQRDVGDMRVAEQAVRKELEAALLELQESRDAAAAAQTALEQEASDLREARTVLAAELTAAESHVEELAAAVADRDAALAAAAAEAAALRDENAGAATQLAAAHAEQESLLARAQEWEGRVDAQATETLTAKAEAAALQTQLDAAEQRVVELMAALSEVEARTADGLKEVMERVDATKQQLVQTAAERAAAQQELAGVRAAMAGLEEERDAAVRAQVASEERVKGLEGVVGALNKKLAATSADVGEKAEELGAVTAAVRELEAKHTSLKEELARAQEQRAAEDARAQDLLAQLTDVEAQNEALTAEALNAQRLHASDKASLKALAGVQAENEALAAAVERTREEMGELQEKYNAAAASAKDAHGAHGEAEAALAAATARNEELGDAAEKLNGELDELRSIRVELQRRNEAHAADAKAAEGARAAAVRVQEEMKVALDQAYAARADEGRNTVELAKELAAAQQRVREAERTMADMQTAVNRFTVSAQEDTATKDATIAALQDELAASSRELARVAAAAEMGGDRQATLLERIHVLETDLERVMEEEERLRAANAKLRITLAASEHTRTAAAGSPSAGLSSPERAPLLQDISGVEEANLSLASSAPCPSVDRPAPLSEPTPSHTTSADPGALSRAMADATTLRVQLQVAEAERDELVRKQSAFMEVEDVLVETLSGGVGGAAATAATASTPIDALRTLIQRVESAAGENAALRSDLASTQLSLRDAQAAVVELRRQQQQPHSVPGALGPHTPRKPDAGNTRHATPPAGVKVPAAVADAKLMSGAPTPGTATRTTDPREASTRTPPSLRGMRRSVPADRTAAAVWCDVPVLEVISQEKPVVEGVYEVMPGVIHNDCPMWACGTHRIFSSKEGYWMVSADAAGPGKNVGRLVSHTVHEGRPPHDVRVWDYSNGTTWVSSRLTRIQAPPQPQPQRATTPRSPHRAVSPHAATRGAQQPQPPVWSSEGGVHRQDVFADRLS